MSNTSSFQLTEAIGYPVDTLTANNGTPFRVAFFKHSSMALEIHGKLIYTDPVVDFADYDRLPKADIILVSHHHYDHFELEAVFKLMKPHTRIICDQCTAQILSDHGIHSTMLRPRVRVTPEEFMQIETVEAYNYSEGRTQFHPRDREDLGYVLNFDDTRLYLSGDGEDTPEMKSLKDIDIAFLSVNQPYTMTVDQAVGVVKTLRPKIFYPYHYGQTDEVTNLERLVAEVKDICEVRIRPLE